MKYFILNQHLRYLHLIIHALVRETHHTKNKIFRTFSLLQVLRSSNKLCMHWSAKKSPFPALVEPRLVGYLIGSTYKTQEVIVDEVVGEKEISACDPFMFVKFSHLIWKFCFLFYRNCIHEKFNANTNEGNFAIDYINGFQF